MPFLMLKDLPRYDCLLQAAERYPELDLDAILAFMNLLRTADMVLAEKRGFLDKLSLSQGCFTVLMLLNKVCQHVGSSTPAELAEKAGVTRATMTGLIDTLEKDGLACREADPVDRRVFNVRLTPEGQAFVQALQPGWFNLITSVMSPLSEEERKQLTGLLLKIQENLTPPQPQPE